MGIDALEEEAGGIGPGLLVSCSCGGAGVIFALAANAVAGTQSAAPAKIRGDGPGLGAVGVMGGRCGRGC
jgi:hypothetical protein